MTKGFYPLAFLLALISINCNDRAGVSDDPNLDVEAKAVFDHAPGAFLEQNLPNYTKTSAPAGRELAVITSNFGDDCGLPTSIGQLNGGTDIKLYKFDHTMNASAKAMGFSGEIGKRQMLFIQDFIRYDFSNCGGAKKKIGIGLRCYIYVTSFRGKIGYTKLPGIAANVELNNSSCSFELSSLGFGINGSVLAEGLNAQGDYNVENFGKLSVTFNNVLKLLDSENKMMIKPVELPQ